MRALATAIDEGSVDGPRVYASGPGLSPYGGQLPGLVDAHHALAAEEYRIVRNPWQAREVARVMDTVPVTDAVKAEQAVQIAQAWIRVCSLS